jgi:uncharacterized protein YndB with AHSA1/START domain
VIHVPRRPIITYQGEYAFACTPEQLWRAMEEADQFERWWSWLSEFRLDGGSLVPGAVLRGVVAPPLPYRMRIRVELTECEPYRHILASVGGDLEGEARLDLRGSDTGSLVDVCWTVEMMQRSMRLASRFGHPLLQWGHDMVVATTVAGFRRRLEAASGQPGDRKCRGHEDHAPRQAEEGPLEG